MDTLDYCKQVQGERQAVCAHLRSLSGRVGVWRHVTYRGGVRVCVCVVMWVGVCFVTEALVCLGGFVSPSRE